MFFPIGDTPIEKGFTPYVSHTLLIINVLIFFYQISLGGQLEQFILTYGMIPQEIQNGEDLYTLVTNMFLHGGWMHLIGNMIFLWIFGDNIEATVGSSRFLIFYLVGGILAASAHLFLNMDSNIPAIGASGAIAAVMGAYLVMFPKSKIKIVIIILFRTFQIPAVLFLGIWFVQQLVSGIGSFGLSNEGGTAWWAHIGGFLYGVAYGYMNQDKTMKVPPGRYKYV